MSRRLLWGCIAVVLLLLVGLSVVANGRGQEVTAPAWLEAVGAWAGANPGILAGVVGGIVVVLLVRGGARRRAARQEDELSESEESTEFGDVLAHAMRPGGGSDRRGTVLAMHRAGHAVGEIAKATRLSQDAVRAVIEGG